MDFKVILLILLIINISFSTDNFYGFRNIGFGTNMKKTHDQLKKIPGLLDFKDYLKSINDMDGSRNGPTLYKGKNIFFLTRYSLSSTDVNVILGFNSDSLFYFFTIELDTYKEKDQEHLNSDLVFISDVFTEKYGKPDTTYADYSLKHNWIYKSWLIDNKVQIKTGIKKESGYFKAYGSVISCDLKDTLLIRTPEAKKASKMF